MSPLLRTVRTLGGILLAAIPIGSAALAEEKREPLSEEIVVQGRRAPDRYLLGWREYQSQHFVLDSDLPSRTAAELIRRLEKLRAAELRSLLAEDLAIPGRVRVIASGASLLFTELAQDRFFTGSFLRCQTFQVACPRLLADELLEPYGASRRGGACDQDLYVSAIYFVSPLGEPTIVLPVALGRLNSEVIAHEIAHHLVSVLFVHPPPWFREGFASFLQTLGGEPLENPPPTGTHIQSGERVIEGAVGLIPPGLMAQLCRDHVKAGEVLTWDGEESPTRPVRYHAQSWLLYHFLWNDHPRQLSAFERRLANAEDPDLAWHHAFPEWDPKRAGAVASLNRSLLRYEIDPHGYRYYRRTGSADTRYTESPLEASEVHMLLLDARYSVQPQKADWLGPELTKLLEEEPLQAVGISWRAELDGTSPLALLRKAAEKFPADWRAWLLLGRFEEDPDKKLLANQTAVKLNPDSAIAQSSLASLLVKSGHRWDALRFARRATELAPWDAGAAATLAEVDALLDACEGAIEMRKRAMLLGADANLRAHLNEVLVRCTPASN